jgi:hypothetical protein
MVLTPEVQNMLKTYIATIKPGWLFPGYRKNHVDDAHPNKVFKRLCKAIGLNDNGRRLSFHCCRMWFSTKLRNKISDDYVDLFTGHMLRYGGAYLGDNQDELRKQLMQAGIIDLLTLEGVGIEVSEIKAARDQIIKLEARLDRQIQESNELRRFLYEKLKLDETEIGIGRLMHGKPDKKAK